MQRTRLSHAFLFLAALIFTVALSYWHISHERILYYWDMSGYYNLALGLFDSLRENPINGLRWFKQSFGFDFSALFAVPLVPVFAIFGDSRRVYIVAMAVIYLLPLALLLGQIVREATPRRSPAVFWAVTFLTLFSPFLWNSTLAGFPDVGGTTLVAFAAWAYLHDTSLRRWWQVPAIGIPLGLAILFRRHYGYAAPPFFLAVATQQAFGFWKHRRDARAPFLRLFGAGLCLLAVMFTLGLPFIRRYTQFNVLSAYADLRQPLSYVTWYFIQFLGIPVCVLTLTGLGMGLRSQAPRLREMAFFASAYLGFWLLVWFPLAHIAHFYYACILVPIVVMGIAAMVHEAKSRGLVWAGAAYLVVNFTFGLTPLKLSVPTTLAPVLSLGHYSRPIEQYDDVLKLVNYLREKTEAGDPIVVAGSSGILNDSLLADSERQAYGRSGAKLGFFSTTHIDSWGSYPIDAMLQAKFFIVGLPLQTHMGPEKQKVVRVLVEAFTDGWEFAKDFTRLPEEFPLGSQGIRAVIYRRNTPTTRAGALALLRAIQTSVGMRPGGQIDWFILSRAGGYTAVSQSNDKKIHAYVRPEAELIYFGEIPETVEVQGEVKFQDSQCAGAAVSVSGLDASGLLQQTASADYTPSGKSSLALRIPRAGAQYVLVKVSPSGPRPCVVELENLRLDTAPRNLSSSLR